MDLSNHAWAIETFGGAELGDARRTKRLVRLGASVVARPGGTVTSVLPTSAEREAAFRLLESKAVSVGGVADAVFASTARRCVGQHVIVPVDQTSLAFGDRARKRELGRVGNSVREARGLQVMTSLAVDECGTPVGVLDQQWWARTAPPATAALRKRQRRNRDLCFDRETRFWVQAIRNTTELLKREGGGDARPWLQMDRGADAWPVFAAALESGVLITVRASHNRLVLLPSNRRSYLHETLERAPILGTYELSLPSRPNRPARQAIIAVRAQHLTLGVTLRKDKRAAMTLTAISVRETRRRKEPLEWTLLTTQRVETFADALAVIDAYTMRWRVEEFHRLWKSGVCDVERSQLHTMAAITKWATVLAAVAARAARLAYLARDQPDAPASTEFTDDEIEAVRILCEQPLSAMPTIKEMVSRIAQRGGFTGIYSGKPPGGIVIARGLAEVAVLARALPRLRQMR